LIEKIDIDKVIFEIERANEYRLKLLDEFKKNAFGGILIYFKSTKESVLATDSFHYIEDPEGYYNRLAKKVEAVTTFVIEYFRDNNFSSYTNDNNYTTDHYVVSVEKDLFEIIRICGQGTVDFIKKVERENIHPERIVDIQDIYNYNFF